MGHWRSGLSLFLLAFLAPSLVLASNSFENTAIVRTVELSGSLVHVTTTYAVKSLEDGSNKYTIALGELENRKTSSLEAKLKGQAGVLPLEPAGTHPNRFVNNHTCYIISHIWSSGASLYDIELPEALKSGAVANIVVETTQTHATHPWPEEASQKDGQALKYQADLFVISPYQTAVQRTKVKCVRSDFVLLSALKSAKIPFALYIFLHHPRRLE